MNEKRGLKIVFYTSIIAIILFAYLVNIHYQPSESRFCDISEGVSCDIVNKSLYSEIFGIPVSLLGLLSFALVAFLTWKLLKNKKIKFFSLELHKKELFEFLLLFMVISTLFSFWLIYAELFLILSICLLCVIGNVLIWIALFVLIELNKKNIKHSLINISRILLVIFGAIILYLWYAIIVEL